MASPLSKSKIIAHLSDKVSTDEKPVSKKQVASFLRRVVQARGEGSQELRKICNSRHRTRRQSASQGSHGPQSRHRRSNQDQGQDRCALARSESVQRRRFEVARLARVRGRTPRHARFPFGDAGWGFCVFGLNRPARRSSHSQPASCARIAGLSTNLREFTTVRPGVRIAAASAGLDIGGRILPYSGCSARNTPKYPHPHILARAM